MKVISFDFMHLAYRNRFVLSNLKNSKGMCTGAIYGVINSIKKCQRDYPEHKIEFLCDTKPTIRKKIDPEYKRNREKRPDFFDDFMKEIVVLKKVITMLGIDQYSATGYEADDLAFHMAEKFKGKTVDIVDSECIFVTGDSDWLQLVDDSFNVKIYNPTKDKIFKNKEVCDEYNIDKPKQLVFIKVLKGDKSDNIPGLLRFPTKLAQYVAKKYINADNLIQMVEKDKAINDKWIDKILSSKDRLILNEKLIKFEKIRVPIRHIKGEYNEEELLDMYTYLDFDSLRREITKKRMRKK